MARYLCRSYWENRTEQQAKPIQHNNYTPAMNVYINSILQIILIFNC